MCETLEERRLLSIGVFINPSLTLSEGQGGSVAVNLWGGPLLTPLTVHWGIANDSATRPADYKVFDPTGGQELPSSQNQFSVTFPAGSTSFGFAIPVEARLDNLVEGSESFRLVLLPGSGYQIAHPWSGYGDDPGVCTVTISDAPVRVSIYGYNWDREGGGVPYPASFSVRREGGDTSQPLLVTVAEDGGGSAYAGSDFTFASSVTIPAGVAEVAVAFSLVDDTVAEWTETAKLRVVPDSGHYILGDAPSASVDIIDNDLGLLLGQNVLWVNNDDDDESGYPDGEEAGPIDGEDDLYPLTLSYPAQVLYGATVTLSAPNDRVRIWQNPDKSGEAFITGQRSSYTWTIGQQTPPTTVWVEAIAGSLAMNDVVFTLQDSDSVPRNHSPISTTNTTQQAASNAGVTLKWNNQPINGRQAGTVIVGQKIDVTAEIQIPEALRGPTSWTVDGGKPFRNYTADDTAGTFTPLDLTQAGTELICHYADGGRSDVTFTIAVQGQNHPTTTFFQIVRPTATLSVEMGAVRISEPVPGRQTRFGLLSAGQVDHGIVYTGDVQTPAGFGGTWYYGQLVVPGRWATQDDDDDTPWHQAMNGEKVLDTRWPYNKYQAEWAVNSDPHTDDDDPDVGLGDLRPGVTPKQFYLNETFHTYIMFQSDLPGSCPVPSMIVTWWYAGEVTKDGAGRWSMPWQPVWDHGPAVDTTDHPTWTRNVKNSQWI